MPSRGSEAMPMAAAAMVFRKTTVRPLIINLLGAPGSEDSVFQRTAVAPGPGDLVFRRYSAVGGPLLWERAGPGVPVFLAFLAVWGGG